MGAVNVYRRAGLTAREAHKGRESAGCGDSAVRGMGKDTSQWSNRFLHVHTLESNDFEALVFMTNSRAFAEATMAGNASVSHVIEGVLCLVTDSQPHRACIVVLQAFRYV